MRSAELLEKSRVCEEAAQRTADPIVRDAFTEAAKWFYGRVPAEDQTAPVIWATDGEPDEPDEEGEGRRVQMGYFEGMFYGAALVLVFLAGLGMSFEEGGQAAAVFWVCTVCVGLLAFKLGESLR